MDKKTPAFIAALFSFLTWGFLVIYWNHLSSVHPLEVVSHRAIWSLLFSGVIILVTRRAREVVNVIKNPKNIFPLVLSSILIASNWGIFIWAVVNGKIIESSMGNYVTPLLNVAASAIIFKTALNKPQKISVLLALAGVIYMVYVYGRIPYIAVFFAVTFCSYGIIKKLVRASAVTGIFVETLIISLPAVVYILYLIYTGESAVVNGSITVKLLLIFTGILTTLPLLGFSFSAKILHLSTLGLIQYITPTITFLLGIFVYNEHIDKNMIITFILIWTGLIIFSIDGLMQLKNQKTNNN